MAGCTLAVCVLLGMPFSATAAPVRQLGSVPVETGSRAEVTSASGEGARVLLTETADVRNPTVDDISHDVLWALDTRTGSPSPLGGFFRGYVSQSRDGQWTAAANAVKQRTCAREITLTKMDGSRPPVKIALPGAYSRSPVDAIVVAPDGRVTVRVGRCERDFYTARDARAILTAAPGAATFRVLAQSRSDYSSWPLSQNGRVLALCQRKKVNDTRSVSRLTVVRSDPGFAVSSARTRAYNDAGYGPQCVASDSGVGTMTVFTRRHGGDAPAKTRREFREVGLVVGRGASKRFALPYGSRTQGLETARPDGRQVLTSVTNIGGTPGALIDTATGRRGRPFRNPVPRSGLVGNQAIPGGFLDDVPIIPWHPYASAIVLRSQAGRASFLDPRTGRVSGSLAVGDRRTAARTCFLPSGRVLFESRDTRSGGRSRFFLTNPSRTRSVEIDSRRLGSVNSMTCLPTLNGTRDVLLAVTDSGAVYQAAAGEVEASPVLTAA